MHRPLLHSRVQVLIIATYLSPDSDNAAAKASLSSIFQIGVSIAAKPSAAMRLKSLVYPPSFGVFPATSFTPHRVFTQATFVVGCDILEGLAREGSNSQSAEMR